MNRRDVIRQLAMAVTAAGTGVFNLEAARLVHEVAGEARGHPGGYQPTALSTHEFRTVSRLAELIIPADDRGGSGVDAGAPEFIDLLCGQNDDLATIYRDGVEWIDGVMRDRQDRSFVDAVPGAQTALLDGLVEAERDQGSRDLRDGVRFFDWARRMTVDAYYTSAIGIADVGFQGNQALSAYATPQEAIDFVNRLADDLGL